jgi:hypothetical protein
MNLDEKTLARVYGYSFASIHKLYVAKIERKGRTQDELTQVIAWHTGHDAESLKTQIENGNDLRAFFEQAPALNPRRVAVTGVICGVRVEEITEPLMREIRIMDKLVDELAKGRKMEKILRV